MADEQASHAWLEGAFDLHVHCDPSFFPRWGDGLDVVRACEAAGMAGVVLKAHEGAPYEAARLLRRHSPTVRGLGGGVLNRYAGGGDPSASQVGVRGASGA